jgi:hypothetical protein
MAMKSSHDRIEMAIAIEIDFHRRCTRKQSAIGKNEYFAVMIASATPDEMRSRYMNATIAMASSSKLVCPFIMTKRVGVEIRNTQPIDKVVHQFQDAMRPVA